MTADAVLLCMEGGDAVVPRLTPAETGAPTMAAVSASHAIGEVLAFGIGVALSPLAVIALVLMLATPKGTLSGWRSWRDGCWASRSSGRPCWPSQTAPDIMCEVFILAPTDLVDEHEFPQA